MGNPLKTDVIKKCKFGIVQGRLTQSPEGCLQWFPKEDWENEFFQASSLGYNFIELIAERKHNRNNPIWSISGIKRIKKLCEMNNLSLISLCNDYIIDHSFLKKDAQDQTIKLISQAHQLGIQKLILPLFEKSEITRGNYEKYGKPLKKIANYALKNNILICLETTLKGNDLIELLGYLKHNNIQCVFDTGNRIAAGHNIYKDILLIGKHIQYIHIKDKDSEGNNVFLGTGNVNFLKVFQSLSAIEYDNPLTFETCRGNNPIRTAKYNKSFIDFFIKEVPKDGG